MAGNEEDPLFDFKFIYSLLSSFSFIFSIELFFLFFYNISFKYYNPSVLT